MQLVIITGMSGAGKSKALSVLEDLGFYCVDNMPVALILPFTIIAQDSEKYSKVALVTDVRAGVELNALLGYLADIDNKKIKTNILFLDARDDVLNRRFKETRRKHPLMSGDIGKAIDSERKLLESIKDNAHFIVDTSAYTTSVLREHLLELFEGNKSRTILVNVMSFGFKYGTPTDVDIMFDVRFLSNPYYIDELRYKTGLDDEVYDYVFSNEDANEFMDKITDLIQFLLPKYIYEGKTSLVIGIGCTGGKHRSVSVARRLSEYLILKDFNTITTHRDYKLV